MPVNRGVFKHMETTGYFVEFSNGNVPCGEAQQQHKFKHIFFKISLTCIISYSQTKVNGIGMETKRL